MTPKWKVLLVGLGGIGFSYDQNSMPNYVRSHARAFSLHKNFELVASVDPDKNTRDAFSEIYSAPCYESITEACSTVDVDIVVIASPTRHHLDNINEVLKNCKPTLILMEKPAAYSISDADEMLFLSEQFSVPVLVNLIRRADPSVQQVQSMITSERIKPPYKGVVWYSKGLLHNACHFIDLLSFWFGIPTFVEFIGPAKRINDWDVDADLRIFFDEFCFYLLAKDINEFSYYSVELLAGNGRLSMGLGESAFTWQEKAVDTTVLLPTLTEINNEFYQYQKNVVSDIAAYLQNEKSVLPTLKEHIDVLRPIYHLL